MAWNDPTAPVPGYGVQPDAGQPPVSQPPAFGMPQPGAAMPPMGAPAAPAIRPFPTQMQPPSAAGMPPMQPGAGAFPAGRAAAGAQDSEQPDAGDDIWIERTKRAIAESQNDPYRQVQLLQHLNKLYLKERFGREVQADKG